MPRKRKAVRTRQTTLKNIIRGSTGASFAVEVLRSSLNFEEIEELSYWLRKTHAHSPYFRHLLPRSPSQIGGLTLGTTNSVSKELLWAIGILCAEKNLLMTYVHRRQSLDSSIESGDYEDAIRHLEGINSAVGWSHHTLGTMCYLLGQTQGLEFQKDWIEKQVFSKTSTPIAFFAYWLGVRTEPGAEANVFEASLRNYIRSIDNAEEEVFLEHILLGCAASPDLEPTLIRQLHSQSLVDLYEGLVLQAMTAASDFRSTSEIYFTKLIPLMQELRDGRARRISAAMGDSEAFEVIRLDTSNWSPCQEVSIARKLTPKPLAFAPKNLADLACLICDISAKEKDSSARLRQYTYASLWSRLSQFSGTAYRLRHATSIEEILIQYRLRFLQDEGIDSFHFGVLHPAIASEMQSNFSDSESHEVDVGFELGKALVNRDFLSIRTKCAEIREISGVEDIELLRIEIVTYLEEGSFLSLVMRLYPLIAGSNDIIPLVPYTAIAESFTDSVVREVGGHPETSVLLARLVPYTGEQTRLQLIYAIEQFLQKNGVERASELDDKMFLEHLAVRELVFLGCQLKTLALSLSFADGEEIQEERIHELKILGESDDNLKEQCSFEIEEIVRSQEIANAIDKLKSGKIDCDEGQILVWARDNLKGKFDRFRSFVDAGILPTPSR